MWLITLPVVFNDVPVAAPMFGVVNVNELANFALVTFASKILIVVTASVASLTAVTAPSAILAVVTLSLTILTVVTDASARVAVRIAPVIKLLPDDRASK